MPCHEFTKTNFEEYISNSNLQRQLDYKLV